MSKKLLHSITVMFVAFALLFTTTNQAFASSNSKSEGEVEGTISAVGASSISVTPKKGGGDVTVNVDAATRLRRDGKNVLISVLQTGDKVSVKYNKTTMLASKIEAKGVKINGNSNTNSNSNSSDDNSNSSSSNSNTNSNSNTAP